MVAIFAIYFAIFIFQTSARIDGTRYFTLTDDEMVSMRYAYNLVHHHELVWNPGGERVEGFTNPLWVLFMAAIDELPIPIAKLSLAIQVIAGIFLLFDLFLIGEVAKILSGGSRFVAIASVMFTAFYFPLNYWAVLGTEVSLLTLLVTLAVWISLKYDPPRAIYLSAIVLGIATSIRIDMVVPALVILSNLALSAGPGQRRAIARGVGIVAAFLALQTVCRLYYFGELLPNTYYLKLAGYPILPRVLRGLDAGVTALASLDPMLVIATLAIAIFCIDRARGLLLSVFLGQFLYSVYVGGDAWEWYGGTNRYVSIAMPLFFVLVAQALETGTEALLRLVSEGRHLRRFFLVGGALVTLLVFNARGSSYMWSLSRAALIFPENEVVSDQERIRASLALGRITKTGATVAVVEAGIVPFFLDRTYLDLLGKNDKFIARLPMQPPHSETDFLTFLPGHMKFDYAYSIGKLRPDVVYDLWLKPKDAGKYLDGSYQRVEFQGLKLWLRKDSTEINWKLLGAENG